MALIILAIATLIFMPKLFRSPGFDQEAFIKEVEEFRNGAIQPSNDYTLFAFNPNTADSTTLSRLGLSHRVINNLMRYRQKGGYFRKPDDLSKIYGLSEEKFLELKPYISLSE